MSGGALRVVLAVADEAERQACSSVLASRWPGAKLFLPYALAEAEALYAEDGADAVVTDFAFGEGELADRLALWKLPAVLLAAPDEDMDRVERTVREETAFFLLRQAGQAHLRALPLLVEKALNLRESRNRQGDYLRMSEHRYLNLLQAVPDIVYVLDGQGRFVYVNDAARSLGYEPGELLGRHFGVIVHPEDLPRVSRAEALIPLKGVRTGDAGAPKLFDERRSGSRMTRNLELRLKPGDGHGDYHQASVNSYGEIKSQSWDLPESQGSGHGSVGIIRDVTARKQHQLALESALASKDLLLKEIHHRVKNNLQVVSSLLSLQESQIQDEDARKVFLECQTQIQTMSMVHEVLYRSATIEGVEMNAYFKRLVEYLSSVYEAAPRGIACEVLVEERDGGVYFELDDAIPIALVVNELVSNAMKHAFPEGRKGAIAVRLRRASGRDAAGEGWVLEVEDDGVGLEGGSGGTAGAGQGEEAGIGTELVLALASQVRGEVTRGPGRGGKGARIEVGFSRRKA